MRPGQRSNYGGYRGHVPPILVKCPPRCPHMEVVVFKKYIANYYRCSPPPTNHVPPWCPHNSGCLVTGFGFDQGNWLGYTRAYVGQLFHPVQNVNFTALLFSSHVCAKVIFNCHIQPSQTKKYKYIINSSIDWCCSWKQCLCNSNLQIESFFF